MPPNSVFQPIGTQKVARFTGGASAAETSVVLDVNQEPDAMLDVVIQGFNVELQIKTGTAKSARTERVLCPARFCAAGSILIECVHSNLELDGMAWPQVARVLARAAPQAIAGVETGPVPLQLTAVKVTAFDACVVTVGGVAVNLVAAQSLDIRGPATLTSGTALIGYEV
jgi:hypothetical protein